MASSVQPTLPIVLLISCLFACGAEPDLDEGEVAPDTVAEPDSIDQVEVGTGELAQFMLARAPFIDPFEHGAHRELECRRCHVSVAGHEAHTEVACTDCHPPPARFANLRSLSERQCQTCHHVQNSERSCSSCHRIASLPAAIAFGARFEPSVTDAAFERLLSFQHELHSEPRCKDCHTAEVFLDVERQCAACHDDHHRPEAQCVGCHLAGEPDVHREAAHSGCGGAGCHVDQKVNSLPPTRPLCLTCHQDQVEHEAGRQCWGCHGLRGWQGDPLPESGSR